MGADEPDEHNAKLIIYGDNEPIFVSAYIKHNSSAINDARGSIFRLNFR